MPHTIKKTLHVTASVERVWAALTDPKTISAWMGGPVKVTLRKGGRYVLFDAATTGKFTEIARPNTLEYTWRQAEWETDWADSVVRWELKADREGTKVKLTHTNFPNKEERDGHAEGWDLYWLGPMKEWLESGVRR